MRRNKRKQVRGAEAEKISGQAKNYVNNHNVFLRKGKGGKGQKRFIERKKMGGYR